MARSSGLALVFALLAGAFFGCGEGRAESGSPSGSSAPAETQAPPAASAAAAPAPSQLTTAIDAKRGVVLSRVDGGVVAIDEHGKRMAVAKDGESLVEQPAPSGLPKGLDRIQFVGGRLPSSLWLSAALEPEDKKKKSYKTPFYRLSGGKLKEIADDWTPLVVPWSRKRTLAMSTSSGRLKVKVLEPFTKTPPSDQPSRWVPDEGCAKTLKLAEAVALASGEVVAAGRCTLAEKPTYVAVRWPPGAGAHAGEPEEGAAEDEKLGAPMELLAVSTENLRHTAIAARSESEIYLLAAEGQPAKRSRVFLLAGKKATEVAPPQVDGSIHALAVSNAGELWAVTGAAAFRRAPGDAWNEVPLPPGARVDRVVTAGDVVWFAGTKDDGKNTRGVVLSTGAVEKMTWD